VDSSYLIPFSVHLYGRCSSVTSARVMVPSWGHNPISPSTDSCFGCLNKMSTQVFPLDRRSSASSSVSRTSSSSGSYPSSTGSMSANQKQQLAQLAQVPSGGPRHRNLSSPVWLHFKVCTSDAKGEKAMRARCRCGTREQANSLHARYDVA